MGRILYGVMGDSGGHVSRSLAIAAGLREHEIVFVGGGRVAEAMAVHGYETVPVPLLGTELQGQRVAVARTVIRAAAGLAERGGVLRRLGAVIQDFDPDLIVTDYEYFLPLAARRSGRPCISVDRQHALTHCRYPVPPGHRLSRALTVPLVRYMYSEASRYFICSFMPMNVLDPQVAEVFPSVLRPGVRERRGVPGDHAVVYMRGADPAWIRSLLLGRRRRYLVYGFGLDREEENVRFRRPSPDGFLDDLATSAFLVSNGGHNAISEALHLGKPVLCMPTGLFYEQVVNAHLLAEAGLGAYSDADAGAAKALDSFEENLPRYEKVLAGYAPWTSTSVVARLASLLEPVGGS